ncbi:MAG: matrixin family metalloprotease, partial [bacterium]|nr:matrixin family metalloprotease [bacterium]
MMILVVYWFVPLNYSDFGQSYGTSNFSISADDKNDMQFYPNMRFPESKISYKIYDCPLQKEDEFIRALEILEEKTSLTFYKVNSNEEISASCDSKSEMKGGLIVAGEGGPTEVIKTDNFNVIMKGHLVLLRNSDCKDPNIALHEILHVLGFDHSQNPENVMYNITACDQKLGDDTIDLINKIYSYPTLPDLNFENVSAKTHGRYLDTVIGIRNDGLKKADDTKIIIYADDEQVKEIDLRSLDIGEGVQITLNNSWIVKINVKTFT